MPVTPRNARERGFTLIEVLVAVLMLAVIAGGATMAIAGSTRSTGQIKLGDRQKAIASGVLNRVLSNRAWIKTYSCGLGACNISAVIAADDPLVAEKDGTVRHDVRIVATGVDLASDNDASGRDADRQVPDIYRIDVTVTTQAPDTVASLRPWSVSGTLDMSVRATTGTLRLRSCEVTVQADERVGVGLCSGGTQTIPIQPPGGSAAYCPTATPIASATDECAAWRQAVAATRPGSSAITQMRVTPLAATFDLHGPTAGGTPRTIRVTTDSSGLAEVTGLEPGRYRLTPASSASRTLWQSRSVPSGGEVTIQAGEVNDAVQVFRQVARPVTISLTHLDMTDPANHVQNSTAWVQRAIKLVPVPNGRSALANGVDRGWTRIQRGQTSVTLRDVSPGLYQLALLEFPGRVKDIVQLTGADVGIRYIWVPPVSGATAVVTQVPATLTIRDTRCDPARRLQLMNDRITAAQRSLGLAGRGFLWDNPATSEIETIWHGPCTGDSPDTSTTQQTGAAGA